MELGTRIQQLRKARGISQERLAEEMGVSRQAVSKWEQGLSLPSTENLLALAELFAVSADELAGLAAAEPPRSRKRRVFPILLAALVLAAAGVGIFRFARRPADPEAPGREALSDLPPHLSPDPEALDTTRRVYIAWNALTSDGNLSAEDTYRLRGDLYENLQFMDWTAYGALGEAGRETETCMDLLAWLADQDTLSQPELTGLLAGGAGRSNLDGAFAEGYAAALTSAFLRYPETVCEILAGDGFSEQDQDYVIGGVAYGAWPEDLQQQALEAAEGAVIQSHTEAARAIAGDIRRKLTDS